MCEEGALLLRCLLISLAAVLPATAAVAIEFETVRHTLRAAAYDLIERDGSVVIEIAGGPVYRVGLADGRLSFEPDIPDISHTKPADALPDTEISRGSGSIRSAWLASPTERYGHGVLGDAIEAGAVIAKLADGSMARFDLGADAVFEDRMVRIVDMDGDGSDELLVVKSFLSAGAAMTLLAVKDGELVIAAEAPAIGMANRWLNPIGVADFDGDGRFEAAAVITPHIGGTLKLYERRGGNLVEDHAQFGFSNHAMGSRVLALAAIVDVNGDRVPDIVVPDAGRRNLLVVTFAQGTYRELARWPIAGRLAKGVVAADLDGDGDDEIVYGDGERRLNVGRLEEFPIFPRSVRIRVI